MGVEVLEEIIDFEIRDVIKSLNEIPFIQTISCCSGWASSESDEVNRNSVSDGINRIWVKNAHIHIITTDNHKMIDFIEFLKNKLTFDYRGFQSYELETKYLETLSSVGFVDDGYPIISLSLGCKNQKLVYMIYFNDLNRTTEQMEKIWTLFKNTVDEFKQTLI